MTRLLSVTSTKRWSRQVTSGTKPRTPLMRRPPTASCILSEAVMVVMLGKGITRTRGSRASARSCVRIILDTEEVTGSDPVSPLPETASDPQKRRTAAVFVHSMRVPEIAFIPTGAADVAQSQGGRDARAYLPSQSGRAAGSNCTSSMGASSRRPRAMMPGWSLNSTTKSTAASPARLGSAHSSATGSR
jgi:hypothetical protein